MCLTQLLLLWCCFYCIIFLCNNSLIGSDILLHDLQRVSSPIHPSIYHPPLSLLFPSITLSPPSLPLYLYPFLHHPPIHHLIIILHLLSVVLYIIIILSSSYISRYSQFFCCEIVLNCAGFSAGKRSRYHSLHAALHSMNVVGIRVAYWQIIQLIRSCYTMLCYAKLYYAILCYAILWYVMLSYCIPMYHMSTVSSLCSDILYVCLMI